MSDFHECGGGSFASSGRLVYPRSVAIIMDGNGRWATRRRLARFSGHRAGAEALDRVTEAAARAGTEWLTLYAFSTENWNRPRREVDMLWRLLVRDLRRRGPKCLREGIRLTSIGRRDRMPPLALRELERVQKMTAHCDRMTLCLALDYGGMWDLAQIAERVRQKVLAGTLADGPIEISSLPELLGSGKVPPVDLLIRTGGDSRVSNFLPWQLSYAELMFVSTLWPDFGEADLLECYEHFSKKERRFGRIVERQPAPAGEEQTT